MTWPALSDYQEAVQTPSVSFQDAELRTAIPTPDPLGLPRAMSGNFAVVFPVRNGVRTWAVRCFSTFHADQEARYRAISQHLRTHSLPWMVDFQYLAEGIRARGAWYPILKMEWIEGELLNRYVARHLRQPDALFRLTQQFVRLVSDLEVHGIAHGDLQHANLIVANDQLRLIDYDGMYVPSLRGMGSHELGHVNYQHPRRSYRDFDLHVDNFSAWVIYLSLLALSLDPDLWKLADSGDENLLFRQRDFTAPHASSTLRALKVSSASSLNGIAAYLTSLVQGEVAQVPRLRKDSLQLVAAAAERSGSRVPDWLEVERRAVNPRPPWAGPRQVRRRNHPAPQMAPSPGSAAHQNLSAPLPEWLEQSPAPQATISERRPGGRLVLGLWLLTLPAVLALALGGVVAPAAAGGLLLLSILSAQAVLVGSYVASRAFRRKATLLLRIRLLRSERRRLKAAMDRLTVRERRLEARRRQALAQALQRHQERYMRTELSRYLLFVAPVPGLGLVLRARLFAAGYRTAADIGPQVSRVPGIGPARAAALLSWQRSCQAHAARHMPLSLPAADVAAINRRWNRRLSWVRKSLAETTQSYTAKGQALAAAERDVQPYLGVTLRGDLGEVLSP